MNLYFILGAVLGLASVVLGSLASHTVPVPPESLPTIKTALHYHALYAVLIVVLSLAIEIKDFSHIRRGLQRSCFLFGTGVLLFSGGLYLSIFTAFPAVVYIIPVGGALLILGWCNLIWVGGAMKRKTARVSV